MSTSPKRGDRINDNSHNPLHWPSDPAPFLLLEGKERLVSIAGQIQSAELDLGAMENARRPGAWSDALNDFFDCDIGYPGDFATGCLSRATGSGIRVASLRSDPMVVRRAHEHIARNDDDAYSVLFPLDQAVHFAQRGRTASVKGGDFAFINIGEALEYQQNAPTSVQLFLAPGAMLRERIPDADDGVARSFAHIAMHAIFVESARVFCANAAGLRSEEIAKVTAGLIDLLALVLLGADISCGETTVMSAHRRRALRLIERHYADPMFDVERLVAMMGLSDRYLQRIFAASKETCSDVIRSRRIREAQRLLGSRKSSGIMVSQVGYAVGFSDPAHFSRIFRNLVGCAPRDYTHE